MTLQDTLPGLVRILLGLAPVCLFLAGLMVLDSYKLVRPRIVLLLLLGGCLAAAASLGCNRLAMVSFGFTPSFLARNLAPPMEELCKGLPLLILLRGKRIGFLVDAAICGFALGTGFALLENLTYFQALPRSPMSLWVIRGFGTAVMHGGTTALVGLLAKAMARDGARTVLPGLLGLTAASLIHAGFNHFFLSPAASALAVVLVLPPALVLAFAQSERTLHSWLRSGLDLDAELLQAIIEGNFTASAPGRYLQTLHDHFPGPVMADMICYLRLHSELALLAKGRLMLREHDLPVSPVPDLPDKLAELKFLRRSLGPTGQLALAPVLHASAREIWQLQMLEDDG